MKLERVALALFVTCTMLAASSLSNACSISVGEESPLEFNRVTLSGDTLIKVAKRVIDAPIWFNGQWQIEVFGFAFPNESNPKILAEKRKNYAIRVITDVLGVSPEHFTMSGSEVYPPSSLRYERGSRDYYPALEISVAPICPRGGCHLCGSP
ncbi:hypothetical protein [Burkholderia ubonensis]|uniref:hypothetical protein n=1 Tax=Burkholderia ubonensis TaxID=101571 RepID=UPI0012FCB1D8|nr:hypothetical protein [Burkholderia ubonensis]